MTVADETATAARRPNQHAGGLPNDIGMLYCRPGELFARLPSTNRWSAALGLLLAIYVAYAMAVVSTGILDYEIDLLSQHQITDYRRQHEADDNPEELVVALDLLEKGATFNKLLTKVVWFIGGPVRVLISVGIVSGILFVVVALRGGKPDPTILTGVVVFASYVEVPRMILRVLLMVQIEASRVETSAAAFVSDPAVGLIGYLALRRLDPFEWWFWVLLSVGLHRSGQLRGRMVVVVVLAIALAAALLTSVLEIPDLATFEFAVPEASNQ